MGEAAEKPELPCTDLLTVEEFAEWMRISRNTAYAMLQRREVPGIVKVGRVIRISKAAVVKWAEAGYHRPVRVRRAR